MPNDQPSAADRYVGAPHAQRINRCGGFKFRVSGVVAMRALELTITGVVQGVGFRPFIYRLA
ncbi:MAG TPA: acylphosphatase, partial [Conexivisphaerales archaeon]|nr:acylphosphatase [Conexivisphaerales archaeon]